MPAFIAVQSMSRGHAVRLRPAAVSWPSQFTAVIPSAEGTCLRSAQPSSLGPATARVLGCSKMKVMWVVQIEEPSDKLVMT